MTKQPKAGKIVLTAALAASLSAAVPAGQAFARTEPAPTPGQIYLGDSGTVNDVGKYIQYTTTIDEATRTITWDITLNKDHERWKIGFSEYAFLPSGLDNSTIHIDRRYTDNDVDWIDQKPFTSEGSEAGGTDYYPDPAQWDQYYQESVIVGAAKKDSGKTLYLNTLQSWRDTNALGGPLAYNQEGVTSAKFNWVITAKYNEGVNPYDLPFVFGIQQGSGKWPYYIAYGPFNSDNHNLSDVMEGYYGLDPMFTDTLSQYIKPTFTEDQKVGIKDKSNLTSAEQGKVKEAIIESVGRAIDANSRFNAEQKKHILDKLVVEVAPDGTATITYPDFREGVADSRTELSPADYAKDRTQSYPPVINDVRSSSKTISGTGEPGATINLTIPGESGDVHRTATVQPDGTWSVTLNENSPIKEGDTITATQTENGLSASEPATTQVQPDYASEITPANPGTTTTVENPSALTDDEKQQVKDEVEKANPNLPEGTTVTVGDDGTATITYPDGSKDTIPGTDTVTRRETSKAPTMNAVTTASTAVTGTGVPGATVTVGLPDGTNTTATVGTDGTWSAPVPAGTLTEGAQITATQKEADRANASEPATVTVGASNADSITPIAPADKTPVSDPSALTNDEKQQVKDEVEKANPDLPEGTTVTVGDDGTATITYPDGSKDTIPGTELVAERPTSATPSVNPFDSDDTTMTGTGEPGATITVTYPDGSTQTTQVKSDGSWSVPAPESVQAGDTVSVTQTEPGKKPAEVTVSTNSTTADTTDAKGPGTKVVVDNPTALTNDEKQQVKDGVEKANDFPEGTEVTVADNGTVTVKYPDGSQDVIDSKDTVSPRSTSEAPVVNPFDSDDTAVTGQGVPGATVSVTFPDGSTGSATVGEDGTWSVGLPEGVDVKAGEMLTVTQTEPGEKPAQVTITTNKTVAEEYLDSHDGVVQVPGTKVPVVDPTNLTDDEKAAVEKAIREANPGLPDGTRVDVANDGTTTITFGDGSSLTINGSDIVEGDGGAGGAGLAGEANALAETADTTATTLFGSTLLGGALAALIALFRRKKNEE